MYDVAAAKVPVRLSNGNVVIVTPFTNRDLLTIFKMVQKKYLSKMVEAIPHDLPPEQYRAAYAEALAESKGFSIEQIGQLIGELADIDVVHTMLLMAIQKDYNGNADKVVDAIIDVREDFDAVMQAINTSSGSDKDDDERANEKEENDENPPKTSQL
ncbi:MAG: hypothetical protein IJF84_13185 [Thermoguttaceae bacterium]|nr:hypothetical protein [Thermoguttaceae bacterium]